jgi:hypothetical protein
MPLDLTKTIKIGPAGVNDPAGVDVYDEGATEQISASDAEATWVVVCNWTDRLSLALWFTGSFTTSGVITQVTQPMVYPDAFWLFGHSVRTEGVGTQTVGANGMAAFQYARLTVTFKPKQSGSIDTFEKGEESIDFGADVLSFNGAEPFFKWKSDNKTLPAEASPGKIIPVVTFTKTIKGIHTIPYPAIFAAAAAPVNSNTYLGAAPGKLRFDGAQSVVRFTSTGTIKDLTGKFSFRPIEWNKMLRPSTGNFEEIVTINGANPLYASSDFSALGFT